MDRLRRPLNSYVRLKKKMRIVALTFIQFYQRFISPYKGFSCAYRVHTGRRSCSALGYKAIHWHGFLRGLVILRRRTYLCGIAHHRNFPSHPLLMASQRGMCDVSCDFPCDGGGCDLPDMPNLSKVCHFASCCDYGSCDWPSRKTSIHESKASYVYIPPKFTSQSDCK